MKVHPDIRSEDPSATGLHFPAQQTNLRFVDHALGLFSRLTQEQYTTVYPPSEASIGSHLRHVIEFYQSFLNHWSTQHVRYDRRERSPILESSPAIAEAAIREIRAGLEQVRPNQPLRIRHFDGDSSQSDTTRELSYLADHTMHHFALIKLIARQGGITLESSFGFAPSTLAHKQNTSRGSV